MTQPSRGGPPDALRETQRARIAELVEPVAAEIGHRAILEVLAGDIWRAALAVPPHSGGPPVALREALHHCDIDLTIADHEELARLCEDGLDSEVVVVRTVLAQRFVDAISILRAALAAVPPVSGEATPTHE